MEQVWRIFPPRIREELKRLSEADWAALEEIRLRPGQPPLLCTGERRRFLFGSVTQEELEQVLQLASRASMHTVLSQLRQGFLTLEGGHRLGVCGTVRLRDGEIHAIEPLSSMNLRIARQMCGIGERLVPQLCPEGHFDSTLILAPPGAGKTTLLRDVIRCLSDGVGGVPHRVGLADERGEVAALYRGEPQLYTGRNTDVMDGCPKAQGLMLLLRGMNPQVLCADEITQVQDIQAISMALGCGVSLLCTAHGRERADLQRRPVYRELLEQGAFRYLVLIQVEHGVRRYCVEELG